MNVALCENRFRMVAFVCDRLLRIAAMIFYEEMSSQQQIKSIIIY